MTVTNIVKLDTGKNSECVELPAVLTIAGSDSSGGAGIEADLKTFNAHKVYGLSCITCLTAQNTQLIKSTQKTPKNIIKDILDSNFDDFVEGYDVPLLKAIKTGMLTTDATEVLIEYLPYLSKNGLKLVIDPVMFSTSGFKLFEDKGLKLGVKSLYSEAFIITPNFEEAAALFKALSSKEYGVENVKNLDDFTDFVIELRKVIGCKNILVKGGHIPWNSTTGQPAKESDTSSFELKIIDVLYEHENDRVTVFESSFLDCKGSHGTGCTLSSAIAANISKGFQIAEATLLGIRYVQDGMISLKSKIGHGNSPLNHTIVPEEKKGFIVNSDAQKINSTIFEKFPSFFDYLKSHETVRDNWKEYTNHDFVRSLASNKLPFYQFLYFLKQDFYYLHNYAKIHAYAASVAPTYQQTHAEATIIEEVVQEMEKHKEKLCKEYDIDYERDIDIDIELNPGTACLAYCNYLLKLAKQEDFLGIKVALAPCLHGYAEAGAIGQSIRNVHGSEDGIVTKSEARIYATWLGDYTSEWYENAHEEGKKSLQSLLTSTPISAHRLEELVDIFNQVTILEIRFWDEVLKLSKS